MNKLTTALCALGLGMALASSVNASSDNDAIAERLKPVGSVCMEGDDSCGGAAAPAAASGPRTGEAVYTASCAACHAVGVAGAPKFASSDWDSRVEKGMDTLLANAISGINAMPPRGLCADCSDDELKNAIQHMIDGK